MKKLKLLFLLSLITSFVASCKKDKVALSEIPYDYVNTELGTYIIYQVDSIIYDDFEATITNKQVFYKEKVVEEFQDNIGRAARRIERYTKETLDDITWTLARTYYIVPTNRNVEKVEENLRFVSFVYPPKVGVTWKGNRYIEAVDNSKYLDNWTYRFTNVDETLKVGEKNYEHSARILLHDKETAIEKIYAEEIYSRGIGMTYIEWWHLQTQNVSEEPWLEKAQIGTVVTMKAIDFGKE